MSTSTAPTISSTTIRSAPAGGRPALRLVQHGGDDQPLSIGTAYAELPSAFPATALAGAILASISLFVSVGALALPAAAFA